MKKLQIMLVDGSASEDESFGQKKKQMNDSIKIREVLRTVSKQKDQVFNQTFHIGGQPINLALQNKGFNHEQKLEVLDNFKLMVKSLAGKKVEMSRQSPYDKKKMKIDYLKNKEWVYQQNMSELQSLRNHENMQRLIQKCKQIHNSDIKHHLRRNTIDQVMRTKSKAIGYQHSEGSAE